MQRMKTELLTAFLLEVMPPYNKVVPDLSPKLCAIVNKALAREPTGALSDGRTDAPCTRRMACQLRPESSPASGSAQSSATAGA